MPYRCAPSSLMHKTYTGVASGAGLSVSSKDGPVLFVQTARRLTINGYGGGSGGSSSGSGAN
ncbi:jg13404, partial [Pararge aegeria aegeria]